MAKKLEELPVYHTAVAFEAAVIALLERPAFGRNRHLQEQISKAVGSVLANMAEGFEQPTDRALEKYLFTAKASAAEVGSHLHFAHRRQIITSAELTTCCALGADVQRMLGGWIRYLAASNWTDRGRRGKRPIRD